MSDRLTVDSGLAPAISEDRSTSQRKEEKKRSRASSSPYRIRHRLGISPSHARHSSVHVSHMPATAETAARPSTSSSSTSASPSFTRSVQDRIFNKLLESVLPSDYNPEEWGVADKYKRKEAGRPPFSLGLMSTNFRRFNARIGVVFVFQNRALRILQWRNPTHTLSALAMYTFICLDPYLLAVLPGAILLLFVMVPAFIVRHPPAPSGPALDKYSPSGPAIAPPREVKAVSEMSKDFFRNLRDLQNVMEDFSVAHDKIIYTIGPATNFSDEALSSGVFLVLFFTSCALFVFAKYLPWRFIFLVAGWGVFLSGHPTMRSTLESVNEDHLKPREKKAASFADTFIHRDITLSAVAETREVEIFELQRRTRSGEYEPWLFSPSPYEPLSPHRIAEEKPRGTRFFEDVRVPPGWDWDEGKWTLDLGSTTWVQERYINNVEVEEEGERWVYDIDDNGERGVWRRRRWVRMCKRRYHSGPSRS